MKMHPLTPRQPVLLANTVQALVTVLFGGALFALMITVLPPIAWIGHLDEAWNADISFLVALVGESISQAIKPSDPVGSLVRLLDLPVSVATQLSAFGVGASLAVKGAAALFAGALAGMEARDAIIADRLAEPRV